MKGWRVKRINIEIKRDEGVYMEKMIEEAEAEEPNMKG
jgi:hypothetical protein